MFFEHFSHFNHVQNNLKMPTPARFESLIQRFEISYSAYT